MRKPSGGGIGDAECLGDLADGPERVFDEQAQHPIQARRARASEIITSGIEQIVESPYARVRVVRLQPDTAQEVDEPIFPRALRGDGEQKSVVIVARLLEIRAQIEQWRGQDAARGKPQRDQQPVDPAVAVEKRMYRFELRVYECRMHQHRQAVVVEKALQGVEAGHQRVGRRWHVGIYRCIKESQPL